MPTAAENRLTAAKAVLAPAGVLRAGLNTANFLLVLPGSADGGREPKGVAPGVVAEIAKRLGVRLKMIPFESPGALADVVDEDAWDIGLIGAEPHRASKIAFTAPYAEIPATYLVPAGSRLGVVGEVDAAGVRVASVTGSAFDLWLSANVRHAEVVRAATMDEAFELFQQGKVEALAGIRPRLPADAAKVPGSRILDGQFMAVQQAVGCPRSRGELASAVLCEIVEDIKVSGFLAGLIEDHGVAGKLQVAAAAADAGEGAAKRRKLCKARIAVLGCGAMGSIYAALLADAGNDVWAVDVWRQHVEAMKSNGLRVAGASGDRTVRIQATTDAGDIPQASMDTVVVATKASGVAEAAATAAALVSPTGVIVTIQNGLGAGDRIAQHVPADKVMLGVASNFGASMKGPGHAEHASMNLITLGEMAGGSTERLARIVGIWEDAGFKVQGEADIIKMIWEKFICNCAYSGSCTLTGFTVGEVQDCPAAWSVALSCAKEADAVARAQGIKLGFDNVEAYVRKFGSTVRAAKPSMLQDHIAKRRSEIDFINGAVPSEAAKVGLSALVNQTVADLVRARERVF